MTTDSFVCSLPSSVSPLSAPSAAPSRVLRLDTLPTDFKLYVYGGTDYRLNTLRGTGPLPLGTSMLRVCVNPRRPSTALNRPQPDDFQPPWGTIGGSLAVCVAVSLTSQLLTNQYLRES